MVSFSDSAVCDAFCVIYAVDDLLTRFAWFNADSLYLVDLEQADTRFG
jgi:hypothetical protein